MEFHSKETTPSSISPGLDRQNSIVDVPAREDQQIWIWHFGEEKAVAADAVVVVGMESCRTDYHYLPCDVAFFVAVVVVETARVVVAVVVAA